ncbi:hypothetical protein [Flavobacterium sp.]|jgi:hypothetical protein|uniref:hypothetical protein n=1 Tax=Flavobacterium sp. TaxID=239 RepID=UPI0037BF2198
MKNILMFCLFAVSFLSVQCTNSDNNQENNTITQEMLDAKKAEVMTLINNASCTGACNYIAFGSKPCGGPKEYLLFSSAVNLTQLEDLVAEYNEMEHQFNIQTNAISDCAVVLPPNTVACVDGSCRIIN